MVISKGRPIKCRVCGYKFKKSKKEKQYWIDKDKMKCPSCESLYCCIPETERNLRIIQDKYFSNGRDKKYLDEMTKILISYAKSLILKYFSKYIGSDDQENGLHYHSHAAASYVIIEFLKRKCKICGKAIEDRNPIVVHHCKCEDPEPLENNFYVRVSFGKYLIYGIRYSFWGKPEYEIGDYSIDYKNEEGNIIFQLSDDRDHFNDIEYDVDSILLRNRLMDTIRNLKDICDSVREDFIRKIVLLLFFKKGEKAVDKFFKNWGRTGKIEYLTTIDVIRRTLKENYGQT